jgi:hypothetical protein
MVMSTMLLLLALLLVAPSNVSSFQSIRHVSLLQESPFKAVSTQQRVPLPPLFYMFEGMFEGKDDPFFAKVKAAKKRPSAAASKSVRVSPTRPAPPATTVTLPAPSGEALASAFGGAALGAIAASAIASQIPELSDSVSAAIPPLVGAAALGGAAFSGASQESSKVGEMTRKILGKTVIALGRGVVAAVKSVAGSIAAEISSIPGKIVSALQMQVKKTTDKIKAIPSSLRTAAQKQAIEIKATPGRVAESTKQALNKSVDNTKQQLAATVKEVQAFPSKKYTEIANSITSFLGNRESKTPARPHPPKLPPPPMAQSPPLRKLHEINFSAQLPKLDLPKIRIPIISHEF